MIAGLQIGHAHCATAQTGVTVLLPDAPCVMAVDVRGGGPGTRETDALAPDTLVERVHGLVLSGGSVFGLAAADAVVVELARRGIGLPLAGLAVPVVPAAILFDLANGGDKRWAEPPYRRLAREALANLAAWPAEGRVGAGFGAVAGSRPGGIGIARADVAGGTVAAIVAVNSFGEVGAPVAGDVPMPKAAIPGTNTTIGAVVTDLPLTRPAAKRIAMMAHDGLARAIRPIHTPFDGDTLFALGLSPESPAAVDPLLLAQLGTVAADCVAEAVLRAVN